ncbi:carbohydrate sulfotransferase 12-like [Heptranchias perlo]|uniref:carbohydrate sulfotransferase 12-like n=1 Tax=Heptranchias perlo TaxID=212740 RepID=UPI003559491A
METKRLTWWKSIFKLSFLQIFAIFFMVLQTLLMLHCYMGRLADIRLNVVPSISHAIPEARNLTLKKSCRLCQVQMERKKRIREVCRDRNFSFLGKSKSFENMQNRELSNFISDDTLQTIYCIIPKVACTHWKQVLYLLNRNFAQQAPVKMPWSIHAYFKRLQKQRPFKKRVLQKNYIKFLFVREPFVRLISAYRDKIENPDKYFYQYSFHMLKSYGKMPNPPATVWKARKARIKATFSHFIQYLLNPRNQMGCLNNHWCPIYKQCHPCQVKYDFIGKLETLDSDSNHLLQLLGVDNIVFPPKYLNQTTINFVGEWFRNIPMAWREKLYKLYEPDFVLFGYPKPKCLFPEKEQHKVISSP